MSPIYSQFINRCQAIRAKAPRSTKVVVVSSPKKTPSACPGDPDCPITSQTRIPAHFLLPSGTTLCFNEQSCAVPCIHFSFFGSWQARRRTEVRTAAKIRCRSIQNRDLTVFHPRTRRNSRPWLCQLWTVRWRSSGLKLDYDQCSTFLTLHDDGARISEFGCMSAVAKV